MKLFFIIPYLMFMSFLSHGYSAIKLNDGINYLTLKDDNATIIIFSAIFNNNTSHSNHTVTFFVKNNNNWSIIPSPDDNGFIWSDFILSASGIKIANFRLYKNKDQYYIVKGVKVTSHSHEDLTDSTKVNFTGYKLSTNQSDPGVSNYFWLFLGSYITNDTYIDIDDAFNFLDMRFFK
ncbi:carbapenem self-resistance protein CarG family protein [Providencia sp. SP181]|uniref:carbapenem self-resistance protein CarG family protein n=1 Tax=Providencia sp. SP181 TaxID=3136277 RepID=UPI003D296532